MSAAGGYLALVVMAGTLALALGGQSRRTKVVAAVAAAFEPSQPRVPLPDVDKRVAAFAAEFAATIDLARSRYAAE